MQQSLFARCTSCLATMDPQPSRAPALPAAPPNPLALNPLATLDIRWTRAVKSLHADPKIPSTGKLRDSHLATKASWRHWLNATSQLQLRHVDDDSPREPSLSKEELFESYNVLKSVKLLHPLLHWFIGSIHDNRNMLIDDIRPRLELWERSGRSEEQAHAIISRLVDWKNRWFRDTGGFTHHGFDPFWPFKRAFRTILLNSLSPSFQDLLRVLVRSTLYHQRDEASRVQLSENLEAMGILSDFKSCVSSILEEEMSAYIAATCPKVRDRLMLPELRLWFADNVKTWLFDTYGKDATWRKFEQFMVKGLCELRISELFEIIVDYEDKTHPMPCLQDLKDCLQRTGQRSELVAGLREQTIKRLLQPGAATSDILQQYVSTIKVLRYLDPPGVILYGVAEPIRRYLRRVFIALLSPLSINMSFDRERPDTIKIIVLNLIPRRKRKQLDDSEMDDDKEGFLLDDQNDPTPIQASEEAYEDYSDLSWTPAAIDAEPSFRVQKPADIISTLVSIFGSKDLFIKELQVAFGQRLLAISDGNYDDELHNLEVLKIRFGDAALQVCDVMMKDLADSRRLDQHIHDGLNSAMHTTVLSRLFWPPIPKSNLVLPGQFKEMQDRYHVEYEKQRPDKKLRFLPHMGTVDLTVEMDDGQQLSVTVNPLHAAIIDLFSQQKRWETAELAVKLGDLDITSVSLALMYWHMAGVIEPTEPNVFELRDSLGEANEDAMGEDYGMGLGMEEGDDEDESADVELFWNFVQGMLKNLHPMTTGEIHSRFKTVVPNEQTLEDSKELLEGWWRDGSLDYSGNLWSLP
ncbi:hypothetical protein DL93DRAFT_2223518 [Clavulina sp. PMI_390]|nr:hypothetical protein DL93DRAFT_2223518 [Clavulina sp. PMI_390]